MYLLAITTSLCVSYFILFALFPFFFENKFVRLNSRTLLSIGILLFLSFLGYFIAFSISDPELSNRFLHGFGGGFMALLVCFLVLRDTGIQLRKFQFVIFSFLVVTTLGVGNEILEFFLQNYIGMTFAISTNDTWLDLISNTVGTLLGALILAPFAHFKNKI